MTLARVGLFRLGGLDGPGAATVRGLRTAAALTFLAAMLAVVVILSLGIGAVRIPPGQVLAILSEPMGLRLPWAYDTHHEAIVTIIRLPRVLLGALIGAGLAMSGAAMQGLFRNPLADPGLVGVSSGAAVAAVGVIVLGATWLSGLPVLLGAFTLPLAAFAGGVTTTIVVYNLSSRDGRVIVATMLLAGIAVNALTSALTGVFIFLADDAQLRTIMFWGLGNLGGATWPAVGAATPFIVLSLAIILRASRPLNALVLGESEAGHLGFNVERTKRVLILCVALAVGASVAVAGIIGFVGLVVPHLLRLAVEPDHRFLLPASGLLGGSLLLAADLIARTIVAPAELPIGIVTAIIGGPFFLYLLRRGHAQMGL